jgi:hypothetical protein
MKTRKPTIVTRGLSKAKSSDEHREPTAADDEVQLPAFSFPRVSSPTDKVPVPVFEAKLKREWQEEIDFTLARVSDLPQIDNQQAFDQGIKVQADLKRLLDGIEKSRRDFKGPFLETGKKIDVLAKEASRQLEACFQSLSAELGNYEALRRAEKAEQARELEARAEKLSAKAQEETDRETRTRLESRAKQLTLEAITAETGPAPGMKLVAVYHFELQNPLLALKAGLLRYEVDVAACRTLAKEQEDRGEPFSLPGIKTEREFKARVSVAEGSGG